MKLRDLTLGKIGAAAGSLLAIAALVAVVARSESDHGEQRVMKVELEELKKIHASQATYDQAERETILRLCATGKLRGDECDLARIQKTRFTGSGPVGDSE